MLLREHRLDDGAGPAVDALVTHLCAAADVAPDVVIGVNTGSESYTRTLDLVRLPPHCDVWHLPVVAHELGHYVIRELRHAQDKDARPLRELVETIGDDDHAEELVADSYATFTIGPAYPLSCLWLRIDPGTAARAGVTHPSWQRRVHVMVSLLTLMSAEYDTGQYSGAVETMLLPAWKQLTGQDATTPGEGDNPARTILTQLNRHLGHSRYVVGSNVTLAARALKDRTPMPQGVTPAHVLNAAWQARLRGDLDPDFNRRALEAMR